MREWGGGNVTFLTIIAKVYTASEASALKQVVDFTHLMQKVYFTGLHEVALNLLASSYGIQWRRQNDNWGGGRIFIYVRSA